MRSRKMKHGSVRCLVSFAGFPISRQATADSNHAAKEGWVSECKTIIEGARLRETQQKHSLRIDYAFVYQSLREIYQRLMMKSNGLFGMKVS